MKINKNKVVIFDYKIWDKEGTVLDDSSESAPIAYIHGVNPLIPGVVKALEGKAADTHLVLELSAKEGFGERDEALVQKLTKEDFDMDELAVGMQFQSEDPESGDIYTITGLEGDDVILDANHPLAGNDIKIELWVKEIREATPEELEHKHVHVEHEGCDCGCDCDGDDECECEDDEDEENCGCGCGCE